MTYNFTMYGVSKVLVHANDETAGDEETGANFVEFDDDVDDEDDGDNDDGDDGSGDDDGDDNSDDDDCDGRR